MIDVIIIGSGISGAFIARELSKYKLDILVLEKNNDVSNETTMANSAIVHSGYDPEPGSKKAIYNVKGNRMYKEICEQLDCSYEEIGSLTVAVDEEQVETLRALAVRAGMNRVPVELLSREEALKLEPNLSENTRGALLAKTAAIVYPWELGIALMENAMTNGTQLALNQEVMGIEKGADQFIVTTDKSKYKSKLVINCAGVFADKIHNMVAEKTFEIHPRRGQYFVLDKSVGDFIRHVIFPCPSVNGKGVLVTPTTHGNLLVGPTSELIDDVNGIQTTMKGLEFVREHADMIVRNIPYQKVIRSFAGLRPSSNIHDFIIEEAKDVGGFIDVAGIESPGLASSPAIAQEVCRLVGTRLELIEKGDFNPIRKGYVMFESLSIVEKRKAIISNPQYGKMVCRCERVTEAEIVDCIHRHAGATSVKGVKKRVRAGMGRCQGGFCEPLVVEILARELGISPLKVEYDNVGSTILIEETKMETVDKVTAKGEKHERV